MDRRTFLSRGAALLAGSAWLPFAHLAFQPDEADVRRMVDRHLAAWAAPRGPVERIAAVRALNPEYDLMARTFTVLALADVALSGDDRCIPAIDRILADTLAQDADHGQLHWLLPYALAGRFRNPGGRSLFVDGEVAAMLGARLLLGGGERWRAAFEHRIALVEAHLEASPLLIGESYPDECWLFCNALSLAALRMADALDGRRRDLPTRWIRSAREHLVHPETKLLASSCTRDGRIGDGPEGSSIFLAATCLRLVAPDLAEDQYARAHAALGRSLCSFGWAREWPVRHRGPQDVDSGPIVPGFDASPSASGLALAAARAFGDERWWRALAASVDLVGPEVQAANLVGDAVIFHGHVHGPLFDEITRRRHA